MGRVRVTQVPRYFVARATGAIETTPLRRLCTSPLDGYAYGVRSVNLVS